MPKLLIFDADKSWVNKVANYTLLQCKIFAWTSGGIEFWANIMSDCIAVIEMNTKVVVVVQNEN